MIYVKHLGKGLGGGWSELPGEGEEDEVMREKVACRIAHSLLPSRGGPVEEHSSLL